MSTLTDLTTDQKEAMPNDLTPEAAAPIVAGCLGGAAAIAVVTALTAVSAAISGAIGAKIWQWYAVPLGAPSIGWRVATGLCFLAAVMLPRPSPPSITTAKEIAVRFTSNICTELLILGLAWWFQT